MLETCKENGITIDEEYLKEQAKMKETTDYIFSPFRKCMFLEDDDTCKVYDVRPISCRSYFVASDPKNCDTQSGSKEVSVIAAVESNIMGAGLHIADKACGNFPEMMLMAIEIDKR